MIKAAWNVWFPGTAVNKQSALQQVRSEEYNARLCPSQQIRPLHGRLVGWIAEETLPPGISSKQVNGSL